MPKKAWTCPYCNRTFNVDTAYDDPPCCAECEPIAHGLDPLSEPPATRDCICPWCADVYPVAASAVEPDACPKCEREKQMVRPGDIQLVPDKTPTASLIKFWPVLLLFAPCLCCGFGGLLPSPAPVVNAPPPVVLHPRPKRVEPEAPPAPPRVVITMAKYHALQIGMTLQQADAIMGKAGEESSASEFGDTEFKHISWSNGWADGLGNVTATFKRDRGDPYFRVDSKGQFNLK